MKYDNNEWEWGLDSGQTVTNEVGASVLKVGTARCQPLGVSE